MAESREGISKLIKQIAKQQRTVESLTSLQFESIVTEIVAQNMKVLDVQRALAPSVDLMVSLEDHLNAISKIAIECKRVQEVVEGGVVKSFVQALNNLRIPAGVLVTDATFSKAAAKIAQEWHGSLQLVDVSRLQDWIQQYAATQESFAAALAFRITRLALQELATISESEILEEKEVLTSSQLVPQEYRERIVRVGHLPFRLLRMIMSDPRQLHNVTPRQFEEFIADTVAKLGFTNVMLTPPSGDGGRDVIASNEVKGIPILVYFECKKYSEGNKVQLDTLRALLGTVAHDSRKANIGVLVTTSRFTKGSKDLIMSECRLAGKDYDGILGWIREIKKEL